MKVQNSNQNFKGTNLKYQKFDHIIRNVNTQYPRISPYRVNMRFGNRFLPQQTRGWLDRVGDIVDVNRQKVSHNDYVQVIKNDVQNVKVSKLGDCGESSAITLASLIANGIKNFKIGLLLFDIEIKEKGKKGILSKRTYNTTHEFVVLQPKEKSKTSKDSEKIGKDSIILDAWLGFCGNIQKASDIFYQAFMNGSRKIEDPKGYTYLYKPRILLHDLHINVTEKLTKEFAEKYPELVVKGDK